MPRNSPWLVQTSLSLIQGWHANCDIQFIIYDSNPSNPDAKEIAEVTDYVVAYACKGNISLTQERKEVQTQILEAECTTASKADVRKLARQVMNKAVSKRLASKQEVMVHLDQLDLVTCSELIETISLSGAYKLGQKSKTFLHLYASRDMKQYFAHSLHQYFKATRSYSSKHKKKKIPHYVGTHCQPVYPPTRSYARSVLLIHKPWHKHFEDHTERNFIDEFLAFLDNPVCPYSVIIPYNRVKQCY